MYSHEILYSQPHIFSNTSYSVERSGKNNAQEGPDTAIPLWFLKSYRNPSAGLLRTILFQNVLIRSAFQSTLLENTGRGILSNPWTLK